MSGVKYYDDNIREGRCGGGVGFCPTLVTWPPLPLILTHKHPHRWSDWLHRPASDLVPVNSVHVSVFERLCATPSSSRLLHTYTSSPPLRSRSRRRQTPHLGRRVALWRVQQALAARYDCSRSCFLFVWGVGDRGQYLLLNLFSSNPSHVVRIRGEGT